ncbi:hypothetical protein N2W54_001973 [Lotmaria passim]
MTAQISAYNVIGSTAAVHHLPDDVALLALPDAQLCNFFRVSLLTVARWRADVSRRHSPLFPQITFSAHKESTSAGRKALRPLVTRAVNLLHRSPPAQVAASNSPYAHSLADVRDTTRWAIFVKASAPLPTGLPTLDAALLGGLRRGWVTELTGLANSGKTTVAASWCRHTLKDAGRMSMEGCDWVWLQSYSTIEAAVWSIAADAELSDTAARRGKSGQDAVHVACLSDLEALQRLVQCWLDDPTSLHSVGVVVLDSITEMVRNSFSFREQDALQRHDALAGVLQMLKQLAEERQVAVLILTQQHARHASPFRSDAAGIAGEEYGDRDSDDKHVLDGHARAGGARPSLSSFDGEFRSSWQSENGRLGSPDVGELGRLFFHNVNVRLRLREVDRADTVVSATAAASATYGGVATSDPATLSFSTHPRSPQWQLEILKCPLCAPFAIAVQLRVSRCSGWPKATTGASKENASADAEPDSLLLSVVEVPELDTAQQLGEAAGGGELLHTSIDPWDYTEIPTFVYV